MHHRIRVRVGERSLDSRAVGKLAFKKSGARINCTPVSFSQIIEDDYFVALIQQYFSANTSDVTGAANNENSHAPGKCGAIGLKSKRMVDDSPSRPAVAPYQLSPSGRSE
jgi:hypothetical protein